MKLAATLLLTLAACTTTASPHAAPAPAPVKPRPTTTVRVPATDPPSRQTTTTTTTAPTTTTNAPAPEVHATAATPVRTSGPCGGWRDLIAAHFPADQIAKACAVMLCESGGNPNAASPTDDHGLLQTNRHYNAADFERVMGVPFFPNVYDPATNVAYSAWLYGQRGWQPWACA